jgi:hypothetical protein
MKLLGWKTYDLLTIAATQKYESKKNKFKVKPPNMNNIVNYFLHLQEKTLVQNNWSLMVAQ